MNYRFIIFSVILPVHVLAFEFHLAPFSTPIDETPASSSSDNSSSTTYIYTPSIIHTGWSHHYDCGTYNSGPMQRPTTIVGNAIMASLGTAIFSFGSFFSGLGFYVALQALIMKNKYTRYPHQITFTRLQDACFGTALGCFGLIFTIFGANELKEGIKRIYKIYSGLRFDEKSNN